MTTTANIPTPYTAQSPQVCYNPNPTLTGTTLVLGLYRPATSSNATSVSYWTGSTSTPLPSLELVRDYCTVGPSYTSTFSSEVVMSDDISAATATSCHPSRSPRRRWRDGLPLQLPPLLRVRRCFTDTTFTLNVA